jgi:hypothetical protein
MGKQERDNALPYINKAHLALMQARFSSWRQKQVA